jgi:hypothetical protein
LSPVAHHGRGRNETGRRRRRGRAIGDLWTTDHLWTGSTLNVGWMC